MRGKKIFSIIYSSHFVLILLLPGFLFLSLFLYIRISDHWGIEASERDSVSMGFPFLVFLLPFSQGRMWAERERILSRGWALFFGGGSSFRTCCQWQRKSLGKGCWSRQKKCKMSPSLIRSVERLRERFFSPLFAAVKNFPKTILI